MTADTMGCWAVYYYEVGPIIRAVYATEVDALRAAVSDGTGERVVWLPWGTAVDEAIKCTHAEDGEG